MNSVSRLKDETRKCHWSEGAKAEVAIEYFSNLFRSSNPRPYSSVLESMIPKVSESMNEALTKVVSKEEVREAIFSIDPDSAPGPDGMTGHFFQRYWDLIGDQVTGEIQEVFTTGGLYNRGSP